MTVNSPTWLGSHGACGMGMVRVYRPGGASTNSSTSTRLSSSIWPSLVFRIEFVCLPRFWPRAAYFAAGLLVRATLTLVAPVAMMELLVVILPPFLLLRVRTRCVRKPAPDFASCAFPPLRSFTLDLRTITRARAVGRVHGRGSTRADLCFLNGLVAEESFFGVALFPELVETAFELAVREYGRHCGEFSKTSL